MCRAISAGCCNSEEDGKALAKIKQKRSFDESQNKSLKKKPCGFPSSSPPGVREGTAV